MEAVKKFQNRADIFKALGHPTRLWMVDKLSEGECCVCQFNDALSIDISTISKHLTVLKKAGIVEDDKRGKWVYYRLKVPCILNFMHCLTPVMEQNEFLVEKENEVI